MRGEGVALILVDDEGPAGEEHVPEPAMGAERGQLLRAEVHQEEGHGEGTWKLYINAGSKSVCVAVLRYLQSCRSRLVAVHDLHHRRSRQRTCFGPGRSRHRRWPELM